MDSSKHVRTLLIICALNCAVVFTQELVTKSFCNMETFNISCGMEEVLMMKNAYYGRMEKGRCVKSDLGFLGCRVDVINLLHQRCSGRRNCHFDVPDKTLHEYMPCPEDTTSYLEVSYTCIKVSQLNGIPPRCSRNNPLLLTAPSGYISSSLTSLWNVGTQECPWKVEAPVGQRVNFTLYNFKAGYDLPNTPDSGSSAPKPKSCFEYGQIKEEGRRLKVVMLCKDERLESHLYTSSSNEVTVSSVFPSVLQNLGPFLIKYEVMGCPDLPKPTNGHISRRGGNITVTCDSGNEIWYLTCKGTSWQGRIGNCTKGGTTTSVFDHSSDFPFGILLVVAIGVALGVFLGGLLLILAVIYMKRKHKSQYGQDEFRHEDTLGPRPTYPTEHKTAMMINIHSEGSPHWDHVSKSIDSEDTLLRDPSYRTCVLPYSQQQLIPLGPPPGERTGNVTGPADVPTSHCEGVSRQHIYECPKFS